MGFISILFTKERQLIEKVPDFFRDLNLDQVVETITMGKRGYNLKPLFYTIPKDKEEILYRQNIIKELKENKKLFETIDSFSQKIRTVRKYLNQKEDLHNILQRQRWHLDAIDKYCDAILNLKEELSSYNLSSKGLREFFLYLKEYISSPTFKKLNEKTKGLKRELTSIKYSLLIKGNKIRVKKYSGEPDYTKDIEKTFEKFRKGKVKDYTLSFYDMAQMNHVEEKILEFVAKLHGETFSALSLYYEETKNFMDNTIERFEKEVQFYLSYLRYIETLEGENLPFCLPEIKDTKEKIYGQSCFDIALSYKIKTKKEGHVVCNDFTLSKEERILVVTGPNQGGKTTFARMFGQVHYLSVMGLFVPGKRVEAFFFDNIFTHFEKEENIEDLRGKLEDDIDRIKTILKGATPRSIIIMNEIFSSTTVEDALTLGEMVLRKILEIDAIALLVTFLDELSKIDERIVSMVSLTDPKDPTIRTYKIVRKPADGLSFAMTLAKKYNLTYESIKERLSK